MKTFIKRMAIGSIAVFFTLALMGMLDSQDREITQKKHVTLSVYSSAEGLK